MELASDIIQDLVAEHLQVKEFSSTASFPLDMERLNEDILLKI